MGTTLTTIAIVGNVAVIAHVGDCRIYQLRDWHLKLLTTDHSLVQEMVDEGKMDASAAAIHPYRNNLTRVIGTDDPLELVDTSTLNIIPGDRLLLSTDGLHDVVPFKEIRDTLAAAENPERATEKLLSMALKRGGRDNVTIITVFLEESK